MVRPFPRSVILMEKAEMLEAIRGCAAANGGIAVGRGRFEALTGITESQWLGRHWVKLERRRSGGWLRSRGDEHRDP